MIKFFYKKSILICVLAFVSTLFLMFGTAFLQKATAQDEITDLEITIEAGNYNSYDLPCGVVGGSYPVFDCYVLDNNGNEVTNVDVLVYAPNGKLVSVNNDRFDTEIEGEYKIEYSASVGGVYVERVLSVVVLSKDKYVPLTYEINQDIVDSAYTGERIFIYEGKDEGGSGKREILTEVIYLGEHQVSTIDILGYEEKYFIPKANGDYELKFTINDITGPDLSKEFKKTITVKDDSRPSITNPSFPVVYSVGDIVKFPRVESVIYKEGKKIYLPVKIFVNDMDISSDATFNPSAAGDYIVKYISENPYETENNRTEISSKIRVFAQNSSAPIMDTTLYLENLSAQYRTNNGYVYLLRADGSCDSGEMKYKNKIPTEILSVELGIESDKFNYETIDLKFFDEKNGYHSVVISLKKCEEEGKLDVYYMSQAVARIDASNFEIRYDYLTRSFVSGDTLLFYPKVYENGDAFDGFEGGSAYLTLKLNEIKAESEIKIIKIGGVSVNGMNYDNIEPIIVKGTFSGNYIVDKGDVVRLPVLGVFDLICGEINLSIRIFSPSGDIVYEGALTNDYLLKVEEYGEYMVSYIVVDSNGMEGGETFYVRVKDRTPPTISVEHIKDVKVGDSISLPKAKISDNNDAIYVKWISITSGDYLKEQIIDGTYKFTKSGTYVIEYGAMDIDGNYVIYRYSVICV